MEKPLLWYVCQVAWLTLLAFRYHLGRFRDLTFTIPPYHSLLCFFRYQLGRFRHWVLGICAVSSQSCLQPWQNLGRKGESQMLPIPLIPIWERHTGGNQPRLKVYLTSSLSKVLGFSQDRSCGLSEGKGRSWYGLKVLWLVVNLPIQKSIPILLKYYQN